MKKNNFIQCFLILSMMLISNLGCIARNGIQDLNLETGILFSSPMPRSVTATIDLGLTEINPTRTPFGMGESTPIPVPTLTNLQQQLLLLTLNDEDCVFPCYLGIVLGETSIDEALHILQDLGAYLDVASPHAYDSGLDHYYLRLDILGDGIELRHSIYLLCNGKDIIRMHVSIENRFFPNFADYWSSYFLKNILTQLSDPDYIFFSTAIYQPTYTIYVFDKDQGANYTIISRKNNGLVCPQSDSVGSIGLTHYDPEYYELILTVDNWLVYDPQKYKTVSDVLALSNQEFITQILNESIGCFEITK